MPDQPTTVTPAQLAAIPPEHRRTIARWLLEHAATFKPSWLLIPGACAAVHDALKGAAVDLAMPETDCTNTSHANRVILDLLATNH